MIAQILCIARGSKRLGWSYNKAVLMNGSGETRAGIGTEHKDNATVLKTSEYGAAVQAFLLERREPSRDADGLLRTLRSIPEHAEMRTAAAADLYTHQQREQWAGDRRVRKLAKPMAEPGTRSPDAANRPRRPTE